MMFKRISIFVGALLFCLCTQSKTIYVSSSEGTSQSKGLSASAPVNTIAAALTMGDTILLKAGDVFYEILECDGKYISRYGEGHNPTLCGFKRIKQPCWEQVEPNIWKLRLNSDNFTGFAAHVPYVNNIGCIYEYEKDQIHGRRLQLKNYLKENWDFCQTPSYKKDTPDSEFDDIYLYLETNPNTMQLEFSVGLSAAQIANTTIDRVNFQGFGQGVVCKSNVTVSNCRIDLIGGRIFLGNRSFCCHGSGVVIEANGDVANCQVNDCYISRCYETGVSIAASYQKEAEASNVSIAHNLIANCGRGFEAVMSSVVNTTFDNCVFASNTVLDSGNSGFTYSDKDFARCHVLLKYGMCQKNIMVDGNTFVKGNLCLSSVSQRNNLLSEWKNNTCYLLPTDMMIGNADNNLHDAISISKVGKVKTAVKLFKEETGDKSTHFIVCDEMKIEKEIEGCGGEKVATLVNEKVQ